ncbi:MAG: DUF2279 domain-containing protein [Ginsengibacter sp.]
MKKLKACLFVSVFFLSSFTMQAQGKLVSKDSLRLSANFKDNSPAPIYYPYNKKRVSAITAVNIAGYGGALAGLNAAWYAKQPRSGFHFFNDNAEWLQVDKTGHAYSAYSESRASMELWRWAGLPRNQRIWIGGLTGLGYQTVIEVLDGFADEYGFSVGDFAANLLGTGMFMAQEFAWDQQRVMLKFSFHKRNYGQADLNLRADKIYGKTEIERFLKDYNAQTYWLSANINSLVPDINFPKWLSLAVGYGADGMFGARSNIAVDKTGAVIFDRSDIRRYRQWYLSPDIDLTKIKTNKKGLKVLFFVLSAVKFPAPTLEFSNGNVKGHWIVF